jgi:DNA polymerase-3 subunit gamma/tau
MRSPTRILAVIFPVFGLAALLPAAAAADPSTAVTDRAPAAGSGSSTAESSPAAAPASPAETSSPGSTSPSGSASSDGAGPARADRSPSGASSGVAPGASPGGSSSGALTPGAALARVESVWSESVLPALKPIVRALYSSMPLLGPRDGAFALGAPNDATRQRADKDRAAVEAAVAAAVGAPVKLVLVVEGAGSPAPAGRGSAESAPEPVDESTEIDMDELIDAPPEAVVSPLDRLTQAFPGSVLADGES